MAGAELVDFVMDFAKDPGLVISDGIVFDGLVCKLLFESIDDFDFLEVEDDTGTGTAGNVFNLISLQGDLDGEVFGDEGNHEVETRLSPRIEHRSTTLIDSDVTRIDNVESTSPPESQ
jgi:hypothetical protein